MTCPLLLVIALILGFVAAWVLRPYIKRKNPEL